VRRVAFIYVVSGTEIALASTTYKICFNRFQLHKLYP